MAGDSKKVNPDNTNPNRVDVAAGLQPNPPNDKKNTNQIEAEDIAAAPQEQIRQKGFKSIGEYLRSKKGKPNALTSFDKSEQDLLDEFKPKFIDIKKLAKNNPRLALSCMSAKTETEAKKSMKKGAGVATPGEGGGGWKGGASMPTSADVHSAFGGSSSAPSAPAAPKTTKAEMGQKKPAGANPTAPKAAPTMAPKPPKMKGAQAQPKVPTMKSSVKESMHKDMDFSGITNAAAAGGVPPSTVASSVSTAYGKSAKKESGAMGRMHKDEKSASDMPTSQLREMAHHLREAMSEHVAGDNLPDHVKAKLTLANDYMAHVAHHIDAAHAGSMQNARPPATHTQKGEKSQNVASVISEETARPKAKSLDKAKMEASHSPKQKRLIREDRRQVPSDPIAKPRPEMSHIRKEEMMGGQGAFGSSMNQTIKSEVMGKFEPKFLGKAGYGGALPRGNMASTPGTATGPKPPAPTPPNSHNSTPRNPTVGGVLSGGLQTVIGSAKRLGGQVSNMFSPGSGDASIAAGSAQSAAGRDTMIGKPTTTGQAGVQKAEPKPDIKAEVMEKWEPRFQKKKLNKDGLTGLISSEDGKMKKGDGTDTSTETGADMPQDIAGSY